MLNSFKNILFRIAALALATLAINNCVAGPYAKQGQFDLIEGSAKSHASEEWILIEQGKWELEELAKGSVFARKVWGRDQVWLNIKTGWTNSTGISLDNIDSAPSILSSIQWHLVYVGPWHNVPSIGKEIRLFAWQGKADYSPIWYQFESKTPESSKIPAKPLQLIAKPRDGYEHAVIKWYATHGYNAIAETKRPLLPGFWNHLFRNHELVITGKIVDAEE